MNFKDRKLIIDGQLKVIKRGYAIPVDNDGNVIKSAKDKPNIQKGMMAISPVSVDFN